MERHALECVVSRLLRVIAVFRLVMAEECAMNEKAPALRFTYALVTERRRGEREPFRGWACRWKAPRVRRNALPFAGECVRRP